ncbi:MAG TPA: hypothetical protein VER79_00540 [Candidatus Limnocylindrales bacterium]|nr:hypothetical protein [Candidatus Limnocylindrales bacterium]
MSDPGTARPRALFLIKFIHSAAFIVISLAIVYVWIAIFAGISGWSVTLAIGIILLETAVYVGNGLRCPLTKLAQQYGDARGDDLIADMFLPKWFVPLIPPVCGTLAFAGIVIVVVRALTG